MISTPIIEQTSTSDTSAALSFSDHLVMLNHHEQCIEWDGSKGKGKTAELPDHRLENVCGYDLFS